MNGDPVALHYSIPLVLSPNRHPRKRPSWLGTIIHFTASKPGLKGDIAWLCDPRSGASAHFVIGRDATITQLVPLDACAWHAGISELPQAGGAPIKGCNSTTIGIELDNLGPLLKDPDGEGYVYEQGNALRPYDGPAPIEATLAWPSGPSFTAYWEPYPDAQIAALAKLLGWLADAGHKDAVHNLLGHDEVALPFGRKRDPGPVFPWERFARKIARRVTSNA